MKTVIFCVSLAFFGVVLCDEDHGSNAFSYTDENFADEVTKKPHFVMFFAPW